MDAQIAKNNKCAGNGSKMQNNRKWSGNVAEPVYLIGSSQYGFDGNYKI